MSAVGFISGRFNSVRRMPRSLRTMRMTAGIGIAVATAALVVALAIGRGFERAYKRALLDFNAHIVVMGVGELEKPAPVLAALEDFRFASEEQAGLLRRFGWLAAPVAKARAFSQTLTRRHQEVAASLAGRPPLAAAWAWLDPAALRKALPASWRDGARAVEAASTRGVVAATPFLYREALAIGGGAIRGVVVKGIDPATVGGVNSMRIAPRTPGASLEELLAPTPGAPIPVVLGGALAQAMHADAGGTQVRLLIPRLAEERAGGRAFQEVRVVGTFQSGIHDYDADFLLMRMEDVRRLFGISGEAVSGVEVKLDDAERSASMAAVLERRLGGGYRAITWEELNGDLISAVRLEQLVSSIIMGLMLFVAALNIIAALVLTTVHRLREIALLKAIGFADGGIERLLVGSGMSVGGKGIVAGMMGGILLALAIDRFHLVPLEAEIYLIEALPIDISASMCGILAIFGGGLLWLTSRFAARRLCTINPAEGLAQAR